MFDILYRPIFLKTVNKSFIFTILQVILPQTDTLMLDNIVQETVSNYPSYNYEKDIAGTVIISIYSAY